MVFPPLTALVCPGALLPVLLDFNVDPYLTYAGSPATLVWRRTVREGDTDGELGEVTGRLCTVPGARRPVRW
ncbi:conserved hypothetical protein [Streptomyces sviceus ATCC 29083]|uniref:Uncharacterized protein n=1 Tax=Streptomyces sviceus (strain ATCC 29083 / DSM 924 / JCM 4929 / NBRC 13980 / NCIMB 11184 / NRRL 5439 / UC 5370) TaxID=463191 RepID=B5HS30_STRX2|nr:conserved hypothetical protein [Streptomyces sviceus ATCC 29083]